MMIAPEFRYTEADHAQYESEGYAILDNCLAPSTVDEIRAEIDALVEQLHPTRTADNDLICVHQCGARWLWELAIAPPLLDMVERQVGPNITLWTTHILAKPPRTGIVVPWHQDEPYWNISGRMAGGIWIAIDDVDEGNGTMSVLPGWHKRGTLPRLTVGDAAPGVFNEEIDRASLPADTDAVKVTYRLKAGQLAIHNTMIPHCSTPNTSDRWRRVVVLRYIAADGELNPKTLQDYRDLFSFEREFFLVRGEDVNGRGLRRSPFGGEPAKL